MISRNDQTQDDQDSEAGVLRGPLSRRHFLTAAGVGGVAVAAVAVSGGIPSAGAAVASRGRSQSSGGGSSTTSGGGGNSDAKTVAFAASLEVLAVGTYGAALQAAMAGKLGAVPPAGATFVQTALGQHQAQLDKLNQVLAAAGQPAVTAPDAKLKTAVDQQFSQVKDFVGAAKLARTLEQTAAATYLAAIPTLQAKEARQLAGSIQIIDAQHVAILNYVLGEYPVPDVFAKTDMAATPA